MLWVAFSRRMCCSRVCRASTKPRRPSTSVVSPAIRPGHPAEVLLGGAEEAERRAAVVEPVAERLALADGDVDAALAGRPQHAEGDRVDGGDRERAALVGRRGEGLEVLDRAEEVRGSARRRRRSRSSSAVRERVGVGEPVLEPDLDHLGAEAARVGLERLAAVGWTPRETTRRRRLVAPIAR